MTRRRHRHLLGRAIASDSAARRIYGNEVVTLAILLDASYEWTGASLSSAMCLCTGLDDPSALDSFVNRLSRPTPGREPFGDFVRQAHGVQVDSSAVDWDVVSWGKTSQARRLLATGLLAGPLDLARSEFASYYASLLRTVADARPLKMGFEEATAVANRTPGRGTMLEVFLNPGTIDRTSWELLSVLANLGSVESDDPIVRASAAAGVLASGMADNEAEGAAVVLMLILSRASSRFDKLPFVELRQTPGPAGLLMGWIADLYLMLQLTRMTSVQPTPSSLDQLVKNWPRDSLQGLAHSVALASGLELDRWQDSLAYIQDLVATEAAFEEWYESLPPELAALSFREFRDHLISLH